MNNLVSRSARAIVAFLFLLAVVLLHAPQGFAASSLADGEYTIDFEILKGDPKDDSTSLANGYWNKPATVIVKNGAVTVRTVINKDAWVTAFSTKQGSSFAETKVISRNTKKDTRLVEFKVSSFDEDLVTSMTVDIPSQNYYHSYETRFRFYPDTLTLVKAAEAAATPVPTPNTSESSSPSEGGKASASNAANKDDSGASSSQQAGSSSKPSSGTSSSSNGGSSTSSSGSSNGSSGANAGVSSNNSSAGSGVSGSGGSSVSTGASNSSDSGANAGARSDSSSSANAGPNSDSSSSVSNVIDDSAAQKDNGELLEASSDQAGTKDDADIELQADEATQEEGASEQAEDVAAGGETAEQLLTSSEAESGTTSVAIDEEEKKGGTVTLVIIIIIGVLFIAGSISWIIINRKRNSN